MTHIWTTSTASPTTSYNSLWLTLLLGLAAAFPAAIEAQQESARYAEQNKQTLVLPNPWDIFL